MPTDRHDRHTSDLIPTLRSVVNAGIDPAFDSDFDELERQFAAFRFPSISE